MPPVFVLGCSNQLQLLMVVTHYSWGFGVTHYSWGFGVTQYSWGFGVTHYSWGFGVSHYSLGLGEKQNTVRLMTQLRVYHKVSNCPLNVLAMLID